MRKSTVNTWTPELIGPVNRPLYEALMDQLADGQAHNRDATTAALTAAGHNPSTLNSLINDMARFGLIDRAAAPGHKRTLRLTTLGAQYLEAHR